MFSSPGVAYSETCFRSTLKSSVSEASFVPLGHHRIIVGSTRKGSRNFAVRLGNCWKNRVIIFRTKCVSKVCFRCETVGLDSIN